MALRRLLSHMKSENWVAVGLDLLVVVLGIFIGLQANELNDRRKERALETLYLLELRSDFEANEAALNSTIARKRDLLRDLTLLLEQSALETSTASTETLAAYFQLIQSMPTFDPVLPTYENLINSGDLSLLENRELKKALAVYFSDVELNLLIQRTHELELVETFQPYIIDNMNYLAVADVGLIDIPFPQAEADSSIMDVLHTRKFRNVVTQNGSSSPTCWPKTRRCCQRAGRFWRRLTPS